MKVEKIAEICHEVNRGYCEAIGDHSQVEWHLAPEWQRKSAINGVRSFQSGKRSPENSHQSWLAQKRVDGWVYGEQKDTVMKTHPYIMPFHELSTKQQLKDELFVTICRVLS